MKRKIFKNLLLIGVFLLLGTISFADTSSEAFREIFQQAKGSASGNQVIATIVDAMYFGLITIFRGVSHKVTLVLAGFMVMLLSADSVRTVFVSLGSLDYLSMMKQLIPNLVKGIMLLAILVMPFKYTSSLNNSNVNVKGTLFTWIVEKMFMIFYKLGLRFFGDGRFNDLTPGQMADVFFSTPLTLLQNSFSTWTLFAVFTNIIKILVLVFCIWMAGKIVATLISNTFSALMLCTFSVFFLQFFMLEPTKSMAQRGINTVVSQIVSVFMTVGMVGLSYQTMKLISIDDSTSGVITLAVLLMMMQQCTENISTMAVAMVNGSGLGSSNAAGFMSLLGSAGAIVGGGLMFATEGAENMVGNFKSGMNDSTAQGIGKIFDGAKNMAKNSIAGDIAGDMKMAATNRFSRSRAIKDMMSRGMDMKTAMANTKALEDAQKAFRNKQKALRELEKKQRGIGAGSVAGIGANVLISALSGNLHDTKILGSIASRIGGEKVGQDKMLEAKRELMAAGTYLQGLEQTTGHVLEGGAHHKLDYEALGNELRSSGYAGDVNHFWDLLEKARNGGLNQSELSEIMNEAGRMAKEAPTTMAGDQMRQGFAQLAAEISQSQNLAAAVSDPTDPNKASMGTKNSEGNNGETTKTSNSEYQKQGTQSRGNEKVSGIEIGNSNPVRNVEINDYSNGIVTEERIENKKEFSEKFNNEIFVEERNNETPNFKNSEREIKKQENIITDNRTFKNKNTEEES